VQEAGADAAGQRGRRWWHWRHPPQLPRHGRGHAGRHPPQHLQPPHCCWSEEARAGEIATRLGQGRKESPQTRGHQAAEYHCRTKHIRTREGGEVLGGGGVQAQDGSCSSALATSMCALASPREQPRVHLAHPPRRRMEQEALAKHPRRPPSWRYGVIVSEELPHERIAETGSLTRCEDAAQAADTADSIGGRGVRREGVSGIVAATTAHLGPQRFADPLATRTQEHLPRREGR
jgi:hypothetical protein